jgi:alpha-tubulin suppressor-like RCC1 family protein
VKCWGGSIAGSVLPVDVPGLDSGVVSLATGYAHACAVTSAGAVKCWGDNDFGQLGDGTTNDQGAPVDAVVVGAPARLVGAGLSHTCAVTTGGTTRCWGDNSYGQRGGGGVAHIPNVVSLGLGARHTCVVDGSGFGHCWGDNTYGQRGNGMYGGTTGGPIGVTSAITTAAGDYHTLMTRNDAFFPPSVLVTWGRNQYGQLGRIGEPALPLSASPGIGTATALTAGAEHSCALTSYAMSCWGRNNHGQLGNGTYEDSPGAIPIFDLGELPTDIGAGRTHTCAVLPSGILKCWGDNSVSQLGDGTTTSSNRPVEVCLRP